MINFAEPRFVITLLLIGLFGFAYLHDPSDQAMKGAIIAAFSAAYGFWIGSKQNDEATRNTGEAFKAITATAQAGVKTDDSALQSGDTVTVKKEE